MKKATFLALAAAFAVCGRADEAEGLSDDRYGLGSVPAAEFNVLSVGGGGLPGIVYPLAAAGTSADGLVTAKNAEKVINNYVLAGHEIGVVLSEQETDFYIGEYCDRFPVADPGRIDWYATITNIWESTAYKSGALIVNTKATDPTKRILFTRGGGAVSIKWILTGEGSRSITTVFQVSDVSSSRPHRLYWTEEPFNAPAVDLRGRFVKFYGASNIVGCETSTNPVSEVVNVQRGIWFDQNSQTLRAKAELMKSGEYDGPKGQFVLVYYKNGDCRDEDFICSTVVEVGEPKQTELEAEVGDELLPSGDGWSIEGLHPKVSKGAVKSDDDPMSPYAEVFEHVDSATGNKVQSVYAVTPNDAASVGTGLDAPWKIDIYWQSPDQMDTLWPFERAWYKVSWPTAIDRVVYAADAPLGAGVLVPTNYTASLCGYQAPNGTASLDGQAVRVTRDGHFTLKLLQGTERVFYVPFLSCASTSSNVVNTSAGAIRRVAVGTELTPSFYDAAGGAASNSYLTVDETLPGYIHQPNSKGRNWNARLYHDPLVPQPVDASAATEIGAASVDPFSKLQSAIYAVSASAEPIEVWWRSSSYPLSLRYDAPAPLEYPSSVQRYVAEWPRRYQVPEIALASQLGSDGDSLVERGTAVFCTAADDSLRVVRDEGEQTFPLAPGIDWGFGLWVCRQPQNALMPAAAAGRVFTLGMEGCDGLTFAVDYDGVGRLQLSSTSAVSRASASVAFESNVWTYVWGSVYKDQMVDGQGQTNDTYQLEMGVTSARQPDVTLPASLRVNLTAEQYRRLTEGSVSNLVIGAADAFSVLPKGYTPVEYIESTPNGGQYIDTGYVVKPNTRIVADFNPLKKTVDWEVFFGAIRKDEPTDGLLLRYPNNDQINGWFYTSKTGVWDEVSIENCANRRITARLESSSLTVDGYGSKVIKTNVGADYYNGPIYIFGCNKGDSPDEKPWRPHAMRLYSFQIYEGEKLERDFVPCVTAENVAGLYDTVWGKFYPNVGKGQFAYDESMVNAGRAALGVAVDDVCLARQKTNAERTLGDEDDYAWYGFSFEDCVFWPDWEQEEWMWEDDPWRYATLVCFDQLSLTMLRGTIGMRTMSPGAPRVTSGCVPADGVTPEVYRQPDRNGVGYHPNFAHAFTAAGKDGDYTTWALRDDLANPYEDGLVFTMYAEGGKNRMRTFAVVKTNEYYNDFSSSVTVGKQMLPPKPLQLLDGYWTDKTTWTAVTANIGEDKTIVYRDRKMNDWAKRDGGGYAFYQYKVRDDFDWPDGKTDGAKVGEYTPWIPGHGWYWSAVWPTADTVPTMRVAQTLTKAKAGLPEVWNMASCAVIYPNPTIAWNIVDLIDPVTKQGVDLKVDNDFPSEYGFTLGNSGTVQMRDGKYYFVGAPASVSDRFFYDPNAASNPLCLVGQLVEPATGDPYLQINTLAADEARELKQLCKLPADHQNKGKWDAAIDALAAKPVIRPSSLEGTGDPWPVSAPNDPHGRAVTNELTRLQAKALDPSAPVKATSNVVVTVNGTCAAVNARPKYDPVSNYALMASGNDAGYVTIIENDCTNTQMVADGLPVNVKVIRVVPELFRGTIRPLADPLNKLSEKLVVQYNEPFGAASTNYVFQWRRKGPGPDGTVDTDYARWDWYAEGAGLTSFVLGTNGTSLAELANKYYVMRYRPLPGTLAHETLTLPNAAEDTTWSGWAGPTLAEGWVQRVLNAITPFAQRVEDFYSNPSDIWYTMFEQIGKPYRGDVALNNANLTEVGLLELYQTIFNKAEKMSIANGVGDMDVNKQLLLAASRIADFYMLLGAEAYSDAKNPLVEQKSIDGMEGSAMALPSSTFCFQNQVRTLLDEELALLRGRTCANQPDMKTQPIYNRLIWNFTKGITEGEVAYVNNYGIRATDGVLTVDQAAKQYPQGHGDAWGHYLSAITGYYRLLRNPNFGWTASMMEMMISQSVVNNDDADEQKFADAALKLAQTGLDTVDLTARKAWRDNAGDPMAAYFDDYDDAVVKYTHTGVVTTVHQAFGYGQWATRAGLGGIYNWAVVNSLLPTNDAPSAVYADKGLRQITRATATQLASLCDTVNAIQQKVNTLDAGLNPLGLDQSAIPMDIDPDELAAKNSHFDQLLARAERALENCQTVLDFASRYGTRLQQIQNAETDAIAANAAQEREYTKELIEIYGKPFAGDIGPKGLYKQGYDGPDLYHYMWMDTAAYYVADVNPEKWDSIRYYQMNVTAKDELKVFNLSEGGADSSFFEVNSNGVLTLKYEFDRSGIVKMPDNMGARPYEGRMQAACRKYLSALNTLNLKKKIYDTSLQNLQMEFRSIQQLFGLRRNLAFVEKSAETLKLILTTAMVTESTVKELSDCAKELADKISKNGLNAVPKITGAGLTVNMDPSALANAAMIAPLAASEVAKNAVEVTFSTAWKNWELQLAWIEWVDKNANLVINNYAENLNTWQSVKVLCLETMTKAYDVRAALIALNEAYGDIANLIDEGQRLQREREAVREKISNAATQFRYMDMYNRVQRNNALTKYSSSFDVAQRYVWELAKVYDYETGALSADGESGASFLAEAIAARQLGEKGVATAQATDKGLWDIVTRMKENWAVEKGRLGVNNPDTMTKTFSLRYELFRIRPDVSGDAAWRKELEKYWVDDLKSNAEYVRYCQPLASATATVVKEPGLVIPFSTSINNAENFFGRTLQGGETQFSSADYVTKIHAVGVDFAGYDALTQQTAGGLATEPNVYLVPAGTDYMRSPAGDREVLGWSVVDQVMPLPYKVGSTQLDDENWIAGLDGTDGGSASGAVIRRHSTLRANGGTTSSRLVGRSVWNDRWILVIPASSLNANRVQGLETFIKGVSDIKLAIKAYSRQGN